MVDSFQCEEKSIAHLRHLIQWLSHRNATTMYHPDNGRLLGQVGRLLFLDAHQLWDKCLDSPCGLLDGGPSHPLE